MQNEKTMYYTPEDYPTEHSYISSIEIVPRIESDNLLDYLVFKNPKLSIGYGD